MQVSPIPAWMSRFDPYLKTYVESKDGHGLRTEVADVWQSIRGTNLYSGGPRGSQTDQAIAQALAALRVASQTNDRMLLAEACRLMAHTLNADEQYAQSVDYYQKAIALFESCGAGEQAARTRLGFVAALYMMGNYDEAMEVAGAAEQWFQANNHLSGLAKVYSNIGNLNYRREQNHIALQYHAKARALFERLKDWPSLAMCYLNIANGLSFTDQLRDAEKMYNLSEEISARLNMQELFMQSRYNKSYLMFLQGRYVESLEAFKAVREYFTKTASKHHVHLCDLDVAEIYLHLMKPAEAVTYAQRAIEGFSKTGMRYEHSKAITFSAMGLAQLDRLEEAEKAAATARTLFEREGNKYWLSIVDFCLAYVRLARGDVAKARLLSAQAKLSFQDIDIKGGLADSLSLLGNMALDSSQVKTAAACMSEVMKLTINKRR
jgi:tetratricopeptide (TPR) repeat protein